MGKKIECAPSIFLEEMQKGLPENMAMDEEEFISNLKASLKGDMRQGRADVPEK